MNAIERYKKQVEENPGNVEAWYKLGDAYFHTELYEEALDAFEEASLIDPHNVTLLYRIGELAYSLELYEEAIKALLKASKITSDNTAVWCRLGDAYLASGENNQYYDPVFGKTINFYDKDDDFFYAQAISFYENALAIEPASEDILKGLINACSKLKVFYSDQEPLNEDMLKTLNKASDYLAKYDADSMVQQQKLSAPQVPGKKEENFLSFEAMIASWLLHRAKNKRNVDILMHRMGWLGDKSKTLEEIGDIYELTRERVRQIESKLMLKIRKKCVITELFPLWSAINYIVKSIGILDLSDLGRQLINYFNWNSSPSPDGLESIISLHPEPTFTLVKEESNRYLILKNLKCIECKPISEYLLTRLPGGQISMTSAISAFDLFCKTKCNQENLSISSTFIRYMTANNEHIREHFKEDEDILYTINYWNLFHGRLLAAAEAILKISGRAMHFTEIADKLKETKRDNFIARNIHAALDRSNRVILWGRGTFIHKENVQLPVELLRVIVRWVGNKLKQNIPLVSVHGCFNAFRQECLNVGIPNEVALYSCLRLTENSNLNFPDYPKIILNDGNQALSSYSAIENFIHDASGPVTIEELRKFAIEDLGLKEFQLSQALYRNADILRAGRGEYLHKDYLNIDAHKIDDLVSYIKTILLSQKHVSVEKIYQDRIIDCKLMGIDDPVLLFSVLNLYADEFQMTNYPAIYLAEGSDDDNRGIINEIQKHIMEKGTFCTKEEVYEYFVDKLGYSGNTINFALKNQNIYKYLQGCVIHKETLGWSELKQAELEKIAFDVYSNARKLGKCYGLITDLIESQDLVTLEMNVDWTEMLISELLGKHDTYRILGNCRNAFVPIKNDHQIESFEDLIYEILKSNHKGAANLNDFAEELSDAGIITKSITNGMLGTANKVTIIGQEIILTELLKNAQSS